MKKHLEYITENTKNLFSSLLESIPSFLNPESTKIKSSVNKDHEEQMQENERVIAEYEKIVEVLEEQNFIADQIFDDLMSLPIQQSEKQKRIARSYDHLRSSQNNMPLPSINDESDKDSYEDLTAKHQEAITRGRIIAEEAIRSNKEKEASYKKIFQRYPKFTNKI